jgi:uncharacterized protein (TIGR04222 family)
MNFWRDNFIGDMYGPYFLAFYAIVIGVVIALGWWWVRSADRTEEERVDDPPEPVSSTDLALLRGDVNEVLRLTVVELVQRGFLQVAEGRFLGMANGWKIAQASTAPDPRYLSRLQSPVFDFFKSPRRARDLFADRPLREWFRTECNEAEKNLEQYRLITPDDVRRKSYSVALAAAMGCYRAQLLSYKVLRNNHVAIPNVSAVKQNRNSRSPEIASKPVFFSTSCLNPWTAYVNGSITVIIFIHAGNDWVG